MTSQAGVEDTVVYETQHPDGQNRPEESASAMPMSVNIAARPAVRVLPEAVPAETTEQNKFDAVNELKRIIETEGLIEKMKNRSSEESVEKMMQLAQIFGPIDSNGTIPKGLCGNTVVVCHTCHHGWAQIADCEMAMRSYVDMKLMECGYDTARDVVPNKVIETHKINLRLDRDWLMERLYNQSPGFESIDERLPGFAGRCSTSW